MPYLAFDLDALSSAPDLARASGISEDAAIAGLARMWGSCFRSKSDRITDAHLLGFFGTGDLARLAPGLEAFGFLERLESGFRVRGADRYLRIQESRSEAGKKRSAGAKRDARGRIVSTSKPPAHAGEQSSTAPADDKQGIQHPPALTSSIEHRASKAPVYLASLDTQEPAQAPPSADADPTDSGPPEPHGQVEQLQAAWNELAPEPCPRWRETSAKRRAAAKARLKERPLAEWREVISRIARAPFLLGQSDRGWVANPDWLLRPDSATRLLEGQYEHRGGGVQRDWTKGRVAAEEIPKSAFEQTGEIDL